jgi:membrane-bound lytic murein transglycosylase D
MGRHLTLVLATVVAAACGASPATRVELPPAASPAPAPAPVSVSLPPAPVPAIDPVAVLLAVAERHFQAGREQLAQGHLLQAQQEFDRAVLVLLESPYGARSEPRIRDYFDRLVDRISAIEIAALAEGDGFKEKDYEPASIDELLASSAVGEPPPPPTATLVEAVQQDLSQTTHDIPIPLNAKVLSYVGLFEGRLREFLTNGLQRSGRYLPMIQSVFRAEGLPLDLAYVPLIESSFKPNALSRAKAKGVWQFVRATADEYGLKTDWFIDERSDPEKATRAAAKYLKALYAIFGDWHLALASYNGGPGRVQQALRRSGKTSYWAMLGSTRYLPRETREYVPMILAAIIIAKNPAPYGFDVVPDAPMAFEKVTLSRAVDLRRVAEWTGTTIQEIQDLNPELRRWTTPMRYPNYAVKVPPGTASTLEAHLAEAAPEDLASFNWHTVRRRETIATIARRFAVSRADLAEANGLSTRSRLKVGQDLIIPREPASALVASVDRPAPADQAIASRSLVGVAAPASRNGSAPAAGAADTGEARATATRMRSSESPSKIIYRVKRGDTLFGIARLFQTTVDSVKTWNRLRSNRISPGDRLTIYPKVIISASR